MFSARKERVVGDAIFRGLLARRKPSKTRGRSRCAAGMHDAAWDTGAARCLSYDCCQRPREAAEAFWRGASFCRQRWTAAGFWKIPAANADFSARGAGGCEEILRCRAGATN